jgi:hypothetical protein
LPLSSAATHEAWKRVLIISARAADEFMSFTTLLFSNLAREGDCVALAGIASEHSVIHNELSKFVFPWF